MIRLLQKVSSTRYWLGIDYWKIIRKKNPIEKLGKIPKKEERNIRLKLLTKFIHYLKCIDSIRNPAKKFEKPLTQWNWNFCDQERTYWTSKRIYKLNCWLENILLYILRALEISCSLPPMAHFFILIPYPGILDAFFFNK